MKPSLTLLLRSLLLALSRRAAIVLLAVLLAPASTPAQVTVDAKAIVHPAWISPGLTTTAYQAAALAGTRIVAVGERGTVALSDDDGATWRQARQVPVPAMLTGVSFVDASTGWAVGHWGTILKTTDGGETWKLQRSDPSVDQPFFCVHFSDPMNGVAAGLWSMLLRTQDGGATWTRVAVPAAPQARRADRNLHAIFQGADGGLHIAAEKGGVFNSADGGAHWTSVDTGYAGSLWAGVALKNGDLLAGGLRGSLLRSSDQGATWRVASSNTKSSITGLIQLPDGTVQATALDGITLVSHDNGRSFEARQRSDRAAYTTLVATSRGLGLLFTSHGPASAAKP